MDKLDKAINSIIGALEGSTLVEATQSAGDVIFSEVSIRAKGSIKEKLNISTSRTGNRARSSIEVEDSAKGGENHHAVFLEYGTSKMAAEPFMRPGFDASEAKALEVFTVTLAAGLEQ